MHKKQTDTETNGSENSTVRLPWVKINTLQKYQLIYSAVAMARRFRISLYYRVFNFLGFLFRSSINDGRYCWIGVNESSGGSRICKRGRVRSSAEGASIEAPKPPRKWGLGRGYLPPQWHCHLPRKVFDFESENGDF